MKHGHLRDALLYGTGVARQRPVSGFDVGHGRGLASHHIQGRSADMVMLDEYAKLDVEKMKTLMAGLAAPKPMVVNKPLDEIDNATLVMEMIKRGFAVMKLPESGGPPEALRGQADR